MNIDPDGSRPPSEAQQSETRLQRVLRYLTEPPAHVSESIRLQARFLSYLLLALLLTLTIIFPLVLLIPSFRNSNQPLALLVVFLVLGMAYGLSRTKHYTYAALLTVSTLFVGDWLVAFADSLPNTFAKDLFFAAIPIIFCSLLLDSRRTGLVTTVCLGLIAGTGIVFPGLMRFSDLISVVIFLSMVAALSMVAIGLRRQDQEEIQRQSLSLSRSEARFRLVSYATNDVVWDWDLVSGQVWRNQSIQRMFGFSDQQVSPVFGWWEAHIHPDERAKVVGSLRAAVDAGDDFWSKEYRLQRADGSYVYVFDRAYIIHDENGKPIRVIGAIMDITTRKLAEEVLRHEALHDPLTGLFNRRYMGEMLEREIRRAERNPQPISVIMLDIDHFKQVNDTLGHAAGDAVLHDLGLFLLRQVRGADIACRYGGDEFMLILPGATLQVARQRAENIRLQAMKLVQDHHQRVSGKLTLSIGVAAFPDHGATPDALWQAADAALYAAKAAGRNQVALPIKKKPGPRAKKKNGPASSE